MFVIKNGLCALLLLASLNAQSSPPTPMSDVVKAANDLGFRLHQEISEDGNAFFSSASITSALLLAYAGARGETALEIERALGLHGYGPESPQLAAAMHALTEALNYRTPEKLLERARRRAPGWTDPLTLRCVNAFWGQEDHPWNPAYLEHLAAVYKSELHPVDFASDPAKAVETINNAIARQTENKIRDLLPLSAISPATKLILTNAMYFKNSWAEEFAKSATTDLPFETNAENRFDLPMMRRTDHMNYWQSEDAEFAQLQYSGNRQSMILVLPKQRHGLASLEKKLTADHLSTAIKHLKAERVALELPRFRIEKSYALEKALRSFGISSAFVAGKADFSAMDGRPGDLFLNSVAHKTFVSVDERGTEAAAVTALLLAEGAKARPAEPIAFKCDQPFLFYIVDRETGLVLFQGRCVDPR